MIRSRIPADEFELDPQVAAELAALDAALRGDTVDDEALVALVRDVRAQAPEIPSDLRKRLRHEVTEGFPQGRRGLRRGAAAESGGEAVRAARAGRRRRSWIAGGSVLTGGLAAVAIVVAVSGHQEGQLDSMASSAASPVSVDQLKNSFDEKTRDGLNRLQGATTPRTTRGGVTLQRSSSAGSTSTEQGQSYRSGEAVTPYSRSATTPSPAQKLKPAVADLASSSGTVSGVSTNRLVEHAVDMAVRVKSGKLDDAARQVGQIARTSGGYVGDSSVSLRTRGAGSAQFTLRVASAKLDATVAALSALGTVTHQDQASQDITSSFDSVQGRRSDAAKVRSALLRALGKATTAAQIASLKARIADNRKTIASLDTQLASVQRRADLTTISLSLSAPTSGAAAAIDDNGHWTLGDALSDAGRVLGTVTGGLLVAAGAALPLAILALIAWPIYRARRKRLREATLG